MTQRQATAIVFAAPGRIELRQIRVPEPRPDEILVRTEVTGISVGTDRQFLQATYQGVLERFPLSYGYQRVGVVEAVGPAVPAERVSVGDRVFLGLSGSRLDPADGLGESGGAYTSLGVAHFSDAYRLRPDEDLDLAELALGGVAAVALLGVEMTAVAARELVVVVGQGVIGQVAAQLSHLRGARVVVSDLIARRLEIAQALGADRAVNPARDDLAEAVRQERERLGNPLGYGPGGPDRSAYERLRWDQVDGGADAVIDTAANARLLGQWLALLRRRGRLCLQGYFGDPVTFDYHPAHLKRVTVLFPGGFDLAGYGRIVELLRLGLLRIGPLITHRLPVGQAPEAFRLVLEAPDSILGMVLDWR